MSTVQSSVKGLLDFVLPYPREVGTHASFHNHKGRGQNKNLHQIFGTLIKVTLKSCKKKIKLLKSFLFLFELFLIKREKEKRVSVS